MSSNFVFLNQDGKAVSLMFGERHLVEFSLQPGQVAVEVDDTSNWETLMLLPNQSPLNTSTPPNLENANG